VVRFKFIDKGVRLAHLGDPVLDQRGKVIGFVTSCAVDKEGMLCGQAIVDVKYSQEDTMLYIFQGESKGVMKLPQELELGDKAIIPTPAKVVSRFM
jgi:glycine hydroxymethyltransferase